MANQKLQDLLAQIQEHQNIVNIELAGWDPRTVPGMVSRKRQSEDELTSLTKAYKTLVGNHLMKVILSGPRSAEFAAFAAKGGVIVVDGSELYRLLSKEVDQTLDRNTRSFSAHEYIQLVRSMASYGQDQGYRSLPQPKFEANDLGVPCKTFDDVVAKVRQGVRAGTGDDLNKLHLEKVIIDACLASRSISNVIPVIITNLTDDEVESLTKVLFPGSPMLMLEASEDSNDKDLVGLVNDKIKAVFEELEAKKKQPPTLNS